MFCHKCGKEIVEDAAFCIHCGAKVVVPQQIKPAQNIDVTPAQAPVAPSAEPTDSYIKPIEEKNKGACVTTSATEAIRKDKKEKASLDQSKKQENSTKKSNSKPKTVLKIYADENDQRFKDRNLMVYISGLGYNLKELNKTVFGLEFDVKVVAFIDALDGGERIKSEKLVIPVGKVVGVQITFENEILSATIISEKDYVGSEEHIEDAKKIRNKKIRGWIIKGILIALALFMTYAMLMAFNVLPDKSSAKSFAEERIAWELAHTVNENVQLTNIQFESVSVKAVKGINEYDIREYLSTSIYSNGRKFDSHYDYYEANGLDAKETKKRAYVMRGTYEAVCDGVVYQDNFYVVVIQDLTMNSRFITINKLGDLDKFKEDVIQGAIDRQLRIQFIGSSINGTSLSYVNSSISSMTGSSYQYVSGKVTVKDAYGTLYVANYDATVHYDKESKRYDIDFEFGNFYRK